MYGEYKNVKVKAIASVAPKRVVNNMEISEQLGIRRVKKQILLTGVERRHLCDKGQSASDLATVAAERVLEKLGWERDSIRVLVFVTQSPDVCTPSTAMIIQKRLGIGIDCLAFDVNLGCSGYVSGLQIASAILNSTGGRGLLLVGDGRYYEEIDSSNTNALLFGDAASATALEVEDNEGFCYSQHTDGNRHHLITKSLAGNVFMDGNAVLLFSLEEVSKSIKEFKQHFSIEEKNIDYYVFHQAQKLIIDGIANECGIDTGKILNSYGEFGNTSTATIPLSICYNIEKISDKESIRLLLCGFGVGLAWSNVYIDIETKGILPIEFSDYYYER